MSRSISKDRSRNFRKTKNKIIIAVEGTNKTERIYFNNFDDGKKKYSITIAKDKNTDPINLVKKLNKEIKRLGLDLKNGDKAFCVFDVDTNVNKNKIIDEATKLAKKYNIDIITSTPCIELWFLLHFEYTTSNLSNSEVIKRLKTYCDYKKNKNIYLEINDKVDYAIERAKKLELFQKDNGRIIGRVESNPNTEVYKIVEYLIKNS